ncbi:MAG TPA: UvrD-helicase domain-containing protein [Gemmataceae bacterium]|nr:UvrD-helicase domain-containing protein [Gemmataceae bacterium]
MRRTDNFRRFNASQRHALDTCRNLAVRANAGSGKTSVIVERIVQLLAKSWDEADPLSLSNIVAITFTRKAAGELQERLAESFRQLARGTLDPDEQAYWSARLEELPRAMVGTIDSFCGRLLREFGMHERGVTRVESDFEPVEGYEEEVLKREAINRVINRLSSTTSGDTDPELQAQIEACRWWAMHEGYAALMDHLQALLNHLLDPETIIQAHQGLPPAAARVEEEWTNSPVARRLGEERAALQGQLNALLRDLSGRKKMGASLAKLATGAAEVIEALHSGSRAGDEQALHALRDALLTKEGTPRKMGLDSVAGQLVPLQEAWRPLLENHDFDFEAEVWAREAADRLVRLLEPVHAEYRWLCQAANRFDYLTLARRMRDLLKTHPNIRKQLKQRYRYIMLDEFQDTNHLHWEILAWLVGSGPDGPLDRDRLFLVGDPQQSIYRFRHADVSVFHRVQDHIRQWNQQHGHADRPTLYDLCPDSVPSRPEQRLGLMPLAENYRSLTPMPLALMDRVFRYVFDPSVHGLDLERNAFEIDYQPLEAGLRVGNPPATGEVRYILPQEQSGDEAVEDGGQEQEEKPGSGEHLGSAQVRAVVDQLISLRGRPKITAQEHEPNTLDWCDMAVLLASRSTVLTELEKEFRSRRVPFVVTKGIGFWQRQEVRDVINLAGCLADSGNELALFAVLRGPAGQLSDTEILVLSQLGMGSLVRGLSQDLSAAEILSPSSMNGNSGSESVAAHRPVLSAAVRSALIATWRGFSAATKERLRRTAARLGQSPPGSWRRRVDRMAHADLLQRCLEESGAYAIYAAEDEGELMLANLDRLFALIRTQDVQSAPGLSRLARWLDDQMNNSLKEEQATLLPGSNAVQIMTVHAAKGLEFPVVAVMKLERRVDRPSNSRLLVKNGRERLLPQDAQSIPEPKAGTVAVVVRNPRRPREPYTPRLLRALQRLDRAQQLAESRRLFYVAATRAKERLILAGRQPSRPGRQPPSWQQWFEDALGIREEHITRMVWQDPARGHTVQIITGLTPREIVQEEKPSLPDTPLALGYLHERPRTPTIATTSLERLRQQWRDNRWEWWLRYRLHLAPRVALPCPDLAGGNAESDGPNLGTVIGTLVHRLFEMPTALRQLQREGLRQLIEAMAANLLLSPASLTGAADAEGLSIADPKQVRSVTDAVEQIWQRLHAADGSGKAVRELLEAAGDPEVPFVLKLGRWQVSGRYDKLLRKNGGLEIVDWKTDKESDPATILRRHEPQMRLYALALHCTGQAATVNGKIRVHLAMLHPLVVAPLSFLPADLEVFGGELAEELRQMDGDEFRSDR